MMRAWPPNISSFVLFAASGSLALGCFLDASPYSDAAGTTTSQGGGGAFTTSTSNGGGGGGITTSSSTSSTTSTTTTSTTTTAMGGGGTGGTTTGGGGTGGSGGSTTTSTTSTPTTPVSCADAQAQGVLSTSGVTSIDPDGAGDDPAMDVYCDLETDGGGWALVYSSIGSNAGTTTDFWKIPYAERLGVKVEPMGSSPSPDKNYYAGWLYKYGKEYRDDIEGTNNKVAIGALWATASSFDTNTMKFVLPVKDIVKNRSSEIYGSQFASGWSSLDVDNDPDQKNCAVECAGVTQHYSGCWRYSLGAAIEDSDPDPIGKDYSDGGWGPHVLNSALTEINATLPASDQLPTNGGFSGSSAKVKRITRYARW